MTPRCLPCHSLTHFIASNPSSLTKPATSIPPQGPCTCPFCLQLPAPRLPTAALISSIRSWFKCHLLRANFLYRPGQDSCPSSSLQLQPLPREPPEEGPSCVPFTPCPVLARSGCRGKPWNSLWLKRGRNDPGPPPLVLSPHLPLLSKVYATGEPLDLPVPVRSQTTPVIRTSVSRSVSPPCGAPDPAPQRPAVGTSGAPTCQRGETD